MSEDEQRAVEYRAQSERQRQYRQARLLALSGDIAAHDTLRAQWMPLVEEIKGTEPPGPARFHEDEKCPPTGPPPRILDFTSSH